MTIRTEQTLRRMWDESLKLASDSNGLAAEAARSAAEAEAAEKLAETHRTAERGTRDVSNAMANEAADLADLVNRERVEAGQPPLTYGDPYPIDSQDPAVTRTDGEVAGNA